MPTGTFEYQTERERLAIEAAIAFVSELRHLAQTAPAGAVLSLAEGQALDQGRELLRSTLAAAVQGRIDAAEEKGAPLAPARAPARSASSGAVSARSSRHSAPSTSPAGMPTAAPAVNPASPPTPCSASAAG